MKKSLLKSAAVLTAALIVTPAITQVASAATATYDSAANVQFVAGTTPVNPLDPTNPDPTNPKPGLNPDPVPVVPGLTIDYASSIDFGQNPVTAKTIYGQSDKWAADGSTTRPDYVQVTDQRGTFAGWNLTLSQDSQLHLTSVDPTKTPEGSDITVGDYLTGATISFTGGYLAADANTYSATNAPTGVSDLTVSNAAQNLVTANANTGVGTWIYGIGAGKSGSTSDVLGANNAAYQENGGAQLAATATSTKSPITLTIPASTNVKAAAYTTNLLWTLSDTPTNS